MALAIGLCGAQNAEAGPRDVAILYDGDPAYSSDIETKLEGTGVFDSVDVIDLAFVTPALVELQDYGAVLVATGPANWSNLPNSAVLGDVLADYHDAGGGVVRAMQEVTNHDLGGRWATGNYGPTTGAGTYGYSTGDGVGGAAVVPVIADHPILKNATNVQTRNATNVPLTPGAVVVAVNADANFNEGVIVKRTGSHDVVDIAFYAFSTDTPLVGGLHRYGWSANTPGATLIANALLYATGIPVAENDALPAAEDVPTLLDVLANDVDPYDVPLTIEGLTQPANGTVSVVGGQVQYTSPLNWSGSTTFTYYVSNGTYDSDPVTVTVNVAAVNDAPVAVDDSFTVVEDTPTVLDPRGNDSDVEGDALTAVPVAQPANGTVVSDGAGALLYTPADDFFGTDSFTYQVSDGSALSNVAVVTVEVTPVNDPPTPNDDVYVTGENQELIVPAVTGVRANDVDIDDPTNSLVVLATSSPSFGTLVLNPTGGFTYTPVVVDYNGPDYFTYQVTDPSGAVGSATVTINIGPLNSIPVAQDDVYSVDEDAVLNVDAANGVQKNDHDADIDDVTTVGLVTNPVNGTLTIGEAGDFEYTPKADFTGVDTFTYQIFDIYSMSNVATVVINVGEVNDAPVANDDYYTMLEDEVLTVPASGVLANDIDPEGDAITATLESAPWYGTVTVNSDGSFTYTPFPNYNSWVDGSDTFEYRVTDSKGLSSVAEVYIDIAPVVDAPVAVDDTYTMNEDTPFDAGLVASILANDTFETNPALLLGGLGGIEGPWGPTGPQGPPQLTIGFEPEPSSSVIFGSAISFVALQDNVDNGELELYDDPTGPLFGFFDYTPNPDFSGTDSFTYVIITIDPFTLQELYVSNPATVTLNVNAVNDAPVGAADAFSTPEDTPINVAAPGILANDTDADGDSLTAVLQDNATSGIVALNGDGGFTYTPNAGFNGIDIFTYVASDGTSVSEVTTVSITVTAQPDAPVAVADAFIGDEDTTLTIVAPGVLDNDTDADGDTLNAILVLPPMNGSVVLGLDGYVEYVPYPNFNGVDSFTYLATDGSLNSEPATVTITVRAKPDAPVANPDNYGTQENTALTINAPGVLADDFDVDGDPLTAIVVNNPVNGIVNLQPDGGFTYTPANGFNGEDLFTYVANDGTTNSEETTVTITVGAVNDAPVANNDLFNVFEDQATTISAPGVLANDTDSDDTVLSATLINGPLYGTLELREDGSFTYEPFPDFNGTDSFTYQAYDEVSDSNVATVTINVVPVDDAPLANTDYYVVDEDQFITVAAPGVLGNDSDSDGSMLTALLEEEPPFGIVSLNGDGSFTYTPDAGFSGEDFFVYRANDGVSNSEATTVTIIVRPRNDRPTALADTYVVAEDDVLNQAAPGVLANDTDDDDDALSATLEVAPLHGAVVLNLDGSFEYTPNPNFNGTDSFTYRADDGIEISNPATVTITVTPVQDVPVANDDNYSTPEDTPVVVAAPGVLGDDVDVDGEALTALLVDSPANGTVVLNADGSFTYTPNPGFFGVDTFTYEAFDGTDVSNIATVTIAVGAVNDVPVANPDVYSLFEDTVSNIAAPGVLQNDTDGDGDTLTASLITGPLYGTLTLNPDGSFTYDPFDDFNGVDTFTYQANDGLADSNVATVTLNVVPQSDVPLANPDFYSTTEELPLVVATPGVLGNDFDADGETLIALLEDNPLNGVVALDGSGSFVYTPNPGFSGTDTFTYRAHDGTQNSDKVTVTISVSPINDVPVGFDDVYNAVEDTPLSIPAANGVLANDYDLDGDTLTAVLINQPLNGTVALNADGSFTYTPNLNFNGQDYFTYRAFDGQEYSDPVNTVTINVAPVQDTPVAVNDMYSVPEDKTLVVVGPGVLGNDSDVDGETLTAFLVDHPEHGIIAFNANGSFNYTPDEDFFGIDTFTYYANDGTENSNLATVTISVGGRNDGPVAVDDFYFVMEDTELNIPAPGVLGNDVDDDGDTLQAVIITPPTQGTLTLNSDGSFTYMPNLGYSGPDQFVYRANDGTTLSNPATVSITVTPVNDAPVLSNVMVSSPLNENATAVLTADLFDQDPTDTFLVTVNWGDGTMPTVINYPAGTSKIFLTHQYLDDNPTGTPSDTNVVTITVQDNNGGSDTENRDVVVNNLAPNFENVTLTQEVPTGGIARLRGTITDVGTQDTFVLTVNWGDGTIEVTNHGPGTSSFDYTHAYAVPGTYPVTVTVQDDDGGIRTINPSIDVRNTADLILTKTANPDPASVGELLTYTMIITNNGPDMAHNVILMDTLPTNVEITSSTPTAIPADGVLNWFLGDLAAGQTLRVDLIVKTLQQGPITNFATVISDDLDPNPANNTAAVTTTIGWLPDGPDLMADSVTVDTICKLTKKGVACKVKLWALVANRGTERANSFIYSAYLSDDAIFAPHQDMKLKTKRFRSLNPGQVKAQNQTIKLPKGYTTTGKFIIVQLDDGNLVFEGNETNNLIIIGPLP